jgi:hypothetical protein
VRFDRRVYAVLGALLAGLMLPAAAVALALSRSESAQAAGSRTVPVSRSTRGVPEIGTLYPSASATRHMCTASVVNSPRGNMLLTAAHCVSGSGAGMVFAPGQNGGSAPYGWW